MEKQISHPELAKECCICLDSIGTSDVTSLSCGHDVFHYDCIMAWSKKSSICPMCRVKVSGASVNGLFVFFKGRKRKNGAGAPATTRITTHASSSSSNSTIGSNVTATPLSSGHIAGLIARAQAAETEANDLWYQETQQTDESSQRNRKRGRDQIGNLSTSSLTFPSWLTTSGLSSHLCPQSQPTSSSSSAASTNALAEHMRPVAQHLNTFGLNPSNARSTEYGLDIPDRSIRRVYGDGSFASHSDRALQSDGRQSHSRISPVLSSAESSMIHHTSSSSSSSLPSRVSSLISRRALSSSSTYSPTLSSSTRPTSSSFTTSSSIFYPASTSSSTFIASSSSTLSSAAVRCSSGLPHLDTIQSSSSSSSRINSRAPQISSVRPQSGVIFQPPTYAEAVSRQWIDSSNERSSQSKREARPNSDIFTSIHTESYNRNRDRGSCRGRGRSDCDGLYQSAANMNAITLSAPKAKRFKSTLLNGIQQQLH